MQLNSYGDSMKRLLKTVHVEHYEEFEGDDHLNTDQPNLLK